MMRRVIISLLAVLIAAVASVGIVMLGQGTSAEATYGDTRACVTPREAQAVTLSMRKGQVQRIFDSKGWLVERERMNGLLFEEREYKACWSKRKDVHVVYVNGRAFGYYLESVWWRL